MGGCAVRPERMPIRPIFVRPVHDILPEIEDNPKNLESYYLFWLDSAVRSPELIETHDELRSIINYMKPIETNTECLVELEKITNGKIFLIANSIHALSILPNIHNHKQLHSIYLYHSHKIIDMEGKTDQYKKVKGVYDSLTMAKRYLEDDVKVQTDLDDPVVIDLSNDENNKEYREKFTLFLKTVNVNAKEIYDSQTRKRLINMCMEYYDGNENEINFMKKFSSSYKPEDATSWYMRGSCLHRLLSRAFNDQDMSVLVDMYSFIVDINRSLKKQGVKQSSPLRVFRGQFISNKRLFLLKNNINQTITMQCFFSAQTSHDVALNLLQGIEPNDSTFSRILFEIDTLQDYTCVDNTESSTSKTVLFMLGTVFKIIDVTETTIKLSQCVSYLNDNYELANESSLVIRGILTYLENGPEEAIEYFTEILRNQSQINLTLVSSIYGQLGYLYQKLGNVRVATDMYEKAMHNGTMQIGLYLYYLDQTAKYHATVLGDWEKAKTLWTQKLTIENTFLSEKEKAQTYENLAHAALETKHYAKTIEYTSAAIQSLPNDHPHLPVLQQQLEYAKKSLCE